jgi:hypothetical protein
VIHTLINLGTPVCILVGTVLRMWDSLAQADSIGQYVPRTTADEVRRYISFFTPMGRLQQAATADPYLGYLRTAQGWFFMAIGAAGGVFVQVMALIGRVPPLTW